MGRKDVLMFFKFIKEFSTKHQGLFKKVLDEFQKAHKQDIYMRSHIQTLHPFTGLQTLYILRYNKEALNRTNRLRTTSCIINLYRQSSNRRKSIEIW